MTASALSWGSAFLAFGPTASLLFLIAYQKAQLIIVVTTSAFAFLLSALCASVVWWMFDLIGLKSPFLVLVPGILFQFVMRCAFVALYHKVETVIETSIERHEQQQRGANNSDQQQSQANNPELSESARLRLELNDWSCGLAAGTGFGGMHAILLYGTLLASEAGSMGTLYQPSCPAMPGLMLSAFNAFFFSVLDIVWMLFTFFGMRRRRSDFVQAHPASAVSPSGWGSYLGNTGNGGNAALALCFVTHTAAAFSTLPNSFDGGCMVSLPILALIVVATVVIFSAGISSSYLPSSQRRRRASGEASHTD